MTGRSTPSPSPFTGERARLTALYGALLVAVCAAMIAVVYVLAEHYLEGGIGRALAVAPGRQLPLPALDMPMESAEPAQPIVPSAPGAPDSPSPPDPAYAETSDVTAVAGVASDAALGRLLTISVTVLACCIAVCVLIAWWMAGRVLRPLGVITATARQLSGHRLHERINLKAPPGALKELADTFDEMLARIETLLTAQQRFTANAAHELRTHLATQRAAAEIGLAEADAEQVARIRRKLIDVAEDNERLIEALLLLSLTDQGLERVEPVRLDTVAADVVDALADEADGQEVELHSESQERTVAGDAVLLAHLVRNLIGNAVRYNRPGGRVDVRVAGEGGEAGFEVRNTGPAVPPDVVSQLFEPFRRLQARRHAPGEGAGLGLSIVASIARAHGATVTARANDGPDGGLTVRVAFPCGRWTTCGRTPGR